MKKTENPFDPAKYLLIPIKVQKLHDAWEAGYKACEKDKEKDSARRKEVMPKMCNCESSLYWKGCYSGSFDLITPESVAHP